MAQKTINGIEVEIGSENVFRDLEFPDAEVLKIKSGLVIDITRIVRQTRLSDAEAARRMGISQCEVSGMMAGDFTSFSELQLMECLNRLADDSEAVPHLLEVPGRQSGR